MTQFRQIPKILGAEGKLPFVVPRFYGAESGIDIERSTPDRAYTTAVMLKTTMLKFICTTVLSTQQSYLTESAPYSMIHTAPRVPIFVFKKI